jgi:hypothetical protein
MTNEKAVAEKLLEIQAIKLSIKSPLPGPPDGKVQFTVITGKHFPSPISGNL